MRDAEVFESTPDGLLALDSANRITCFNRRAEELFGRDRADLIGQPFGALVPGWLLAEDESSWEVSVRREDGMALTLEVTANRRSTRDEPRVLAFRDVTERKHAEEVLRARARQQALVAELGRRALTGIDLGVLMDEAVRVLVADMGVEYANLLELLPDGTVVFRVGVGWRDEIVGGMTLELGTETPAGRVIVDQAPVLIDDLRAENRFPAPSIVRDHGIVSSLTVPLYGQARPLGVLGVHAARQRPFPEGDMHFVQAVANVVATAMERHRNEEQLRERQMVRAEQMAAIGQVAAGVAHELRNPLTSIKGLVQVNLREASIRGIPADDLRVIEHEIRRMERTLQTFLDFARPPHPRRQRFDLAELVERVYALIGGRARKQRVTLRFPHPDGPTTVDGDQDQLQQLLLNLVLNALDAMPNGGTMEVDLREPRDGSIELFVRDTGPGIAAHILPKVFETFVSSKETGIGLGLPVSRRIAEDHNGSLTAYNLPAGGACFALRLPAPTAPASGGR